MLGEDTIGAKIPAILGQGEDFGGMKVTSKKEMELLMKIRNHEKVQGAIPEERPDARLVQTKPVCLLMGYVYGLLTREELDDPKIRADIFAIMRTIPSYITIMIQECMSLIAMLRQRKTYRRITGSTVLGLIQFSQNLMQGGFVNPDPFMQLPTFTTEDVAALKSKIPASTNFLQFVKMDKDDRLKYMTEAFPDQAKKLDQVEQCVSALPQIHVDVQAGTLGHKDTCLNDLMNVKIKVKLDHLKPGQESGYVHSRDYPFLKRDEWFLLVTDNTMSGVAMAEKIDFENGEYEKEFYEQVQRLGSIQFNVLLINDSYKGLDVLHRIQLHVGAERVATEEEQYSQEDVAAVKSTSASTAGSSEGKDGDQSGDEDKPDVETDEAELLRRLRAEGMHTAVAEHEREMAELK